MPNIENQTETLPQSGENNSNARKDYNYIRHKAKEMRNSGAKWRDIKLELKIKSNGHLANLLK